MKYNLPDTHEKITINFSCAIEGTSEQFWSYHPSFEDIGQDIGQDLNLQTNDGQIFKVDNSIAKYMPIFSNLSSDIELFDISSSTMSIILEFLKIGLPPPIRKFQPPSEEIAAWPLHFLDGFDMATIVSLFKAANILGIEHLVLIICLKLAINKTLYAASNVIIPQFRKNDTNIIQTFSA